MNEIMAMVIVATITLGIYKLFELFARRKERMMMIEKMSMGGEFPNLKSPFKNLELASGTWALRIGLLLIGIGFGVTIATIVELCVAIPSSNSEVFYHYRNTMDVLYPACAILFGGIGLVIAYFIDRKNQAKNKSKSQE